MKITLIKMGAVAAPSSEEDLEKWMKLSDASYIVDIKNLDMRTVKQNSALHLWCTKISKTLNDNNLFMTGLFENDIMWTMDLVKTQIIKGLIKKLFDIDSTTKLKRKEIDTLIDTVTLIFGEKKGVEIPDFPSRKLWDEVKSST